MIETEDISADIKLGMLDFSQFSAHNTSVSKRDMERKGVQILMGEMLKTSDFKIVYDALNKPFLEQRKEQISISHSHDWLAITINQKESTGVDIELIRNKVINIKHKFLADHELAFAGSNIEILTLLWAAKEAIYKAYGKKSIEFKNIQVEPFNFKEDGEIFGVMKLSGRERKYKLMYRKLDTYILVLVLNEIKL